MKVRRRHRVAKSESDRECLIENEAAQHEPSKVVRRVLWKVAKGTWKAFKIGLKTTVTNQPFSVALEPTAIATTIAEYRMYKSNHR
ncbi:unnamed protein product [Adineta ricciae]|uniref:Uncharacterized protein n=1 Tax=Adineta ricciae TaxID=249248 RepID=A0A815CXD2_ADIRI|nr:unnamed protein product [Adineta ricciae]